MKKYAVPDFLAARGAKCVEGVSAGSAPACLEYGPAFVEEGGQF
jgi:hypothetical protein